MRRISILALFTFSTAFGCAPNYDTWYDGFCFRMTYSGNVNYQSAKSNCEAAGAKLASIHNEKENIQLLAAAQKANPSVSTFLIGLSCNTSSGTFYWEDGTEAEYTNFNDVNQSCTADVHFVIALDGTWKEDNGWSSYSQVCTMPQRSNSPCDDFSLYSVEGGTRTCYLPQSNALNWNQAEQDCLNNDAHLISIHDQKMNDFLRRSALGLGLTQGVNIGMTLSNDKQNWTWSDRSDEDYDSFGAGFPDATYGECVAMQTSFQAGKWMNTPCYSSPLPYFCGRPVYTAPEAQPEGCPTKEEYRQGDDMYSPSFPSPPTASYCEYVVLAAENQKASVKVDIFEANLCCDSLTIYDGLFGNNVIASLSGYVRRDSVYTAKSNSLRLVWNATSGENVRGFHFTVY